MVFQSAFRVLLGVSGRIRVAVLEVVGWQSPSCTAGRIAREVESRGHGAGVVRLL